MPLPDRPFVEKNPIATKRALRAILKANAICARQPERAARFIVDGGFTKSYEFALDNLKRIPYGKWREFSAENTMRFYALQLYEGGLIDTTPNRVLEGGTNFSFVNELRKELKS